MEQSRFIQRKKIPRKDTLRISVAAARRCTSKKGVLKKFATCLLTSLKETFSSGQNLSSKPVKILISLTRSRNLRRNHSRYAFTGRCSILTNFMIIISHNKCRSSRSQMFFKISVLKSFAIFARKHLYWVLFLINLFNKNTY